MSNKIILEKAASEFRQSSGMGASDPIRLKSLLSKLNVITVFRPLGNDFSGMALKIAEKNDALRLMLVNTNHNIGKQHFTICHELYHLYVQKQFTAMYCKTGKFERKDGEEFNADVFASILLLPEQGIKSLIPDEETGTDKISLKTVLQIEHYYSCSRGALLYRLKDLKLITPKTYDNFAVDIKRGAVQHGYPTDLYEPGNNQLVLGNYGSIARELYEKERISETHYVSLLKDLGMNEDQLEKLFNGSEKDDQ